MIKHLIIRQIKPTQGTMGYSIEPYDIVSNKNNPRQDFLATTRNNGWQISNDRVYTTFLLELHST